MSIRLIKVTKDCNVGLQTAVDFLLKHGFDGVEANPNTKISEEQYQLLVKEFNKDKGLRNEATQLIQQRQEQNKERKEAARAKAAEEIVELKIPQMEGPKVLGRIDLNASKKPSAKDVKPKEEVKLTPKVEVAAPVEKKVDEIAPKPEPEVIPEPVTQPQPVEETVETPEPVPVSETTEIQEEVLPQKETLEVHEKGNGKTGPVIGTEVDGVFRLNSTPQNAPTLTVKGHIDLDSMNQSTRPKKKSREEKRREREEKLRPQSGANQNEGAKSAERKKRVRVGKERVDINAVANQQQNGSKN